MNNGEFGQQIFAQFGWQAAVGKFRLPEPNPGSDLDAAKDRAAFLRGTPVVLQTPRGMETGRCLGVCQPDDAPMGKVLRPILPEDELLHRHLVQLSDLAHHRCIQWLEQQQYQAVLLAVEPLLDGQTLFFHFLGGMDEIIHQHVNELVKLYEAEVSASDFAQRVLKGCGPGCGTAEVSGRGCSTCSNCQSCGVRPSNKRRGE